MFRFKWLFPAFMGFIVLNACSTSKKTTSKTPETVKTTTTPEKKVISDPEPRLPAGILLLLMLLVNRFDIPSF